MISDEREVIISIKKENSPKPTEMGKRRGIIKGGASDVREYEERFERLKKNARKEKIIGQDPLIEALNHPIM